MRALLTLPSFQFGWFLACLCSSSPLDLHAAPRDNAEPEWLVVTYGSTFDTALSQSESRVRSKSVERELELVATIGADIEGGFISNEVGFTFTKTLTQASGLSTSRALASTIASSRSSSSECTLTCPLPGTNVPAVGNGNQLFKPLGVGTNCATHGGPDGAEGNMVYLWRWTSKVSHVSPDQEGDDGMSIRTCHTQCTCTPVPPACDFSECADEYCTYCSGDSAPPPIPHPPPLSPAPPRSPPAMPPTHSGLLCVCDNSGNSGKFKCHDEVTRFCPDDGICHNPFLGTFEFASHEHVCKPPDEAPWTPPELRCVCTSSSITDEFICQDDVVCADLP